MLTFSRQVNSKTPSGAILKLKPTKFTTWQAIPTRAPKGRLERSENSKGRLTRLMVLVFCTSYHGALHLWEISWKYFKGFSTYRVYMVEMAMFNVQRAITPKVGKPELWFMCSACCFIVLCIYVKFRENITKGIKVIEWTRVHDQNGYVQCSKGNNSKK